MDHAERTHHRGTRSFRGGQQLGQHVERLVLRAAILIDERAPRRQTAAWTGSPMRLTTASSSSRSVRTWMAAPLARNASAISAKLSMCGPKITGRPCTAGSRMLCPPAGTRLPPTKTAVAILIELRDRQSCPESPRRLEAPSRSGDRCGAWSTDLRAGTGARRRQTARDDARRE